MKMILKARWIVLANFIFIINANGQFVKTPNEKISPNNIFITLSAEPEIVTCIGYLHSVGKQERKVSFQLGGSIKLAPVIISNGAFRANFITVANWKISEHWQTPIAGQIYLAHDKNREGTFTGAGFEVRANPAYVGKKWSKGFDVGWQYTPFTYIKNSRQAKAAFDERYPDGVTGLQGPKDGWYKNGANRFRIGLTGATSVGNHSALQFSLGSLFIIQKQGIALGFSHAQIPAYLDLSYRRSW
jgi:hypothetical protein